MHVLNKYKKFRWDCQTIQDYFWYLYEHKLTKVQCSVTCIEKNFNYCLYKINVTSKELVICTFASPMSSAELIIH